MPKITDINQFRPRRSPMAPTLRDSGALFWKEPRADAMPEVLRALPVEEMAAVLIKGLFAIYHLSREHAKLPRKVPRYYLDFETIDHVIPRWANTRPYQQIPFQWSCHVEQRNGALREDAFLDLSGEAPMRPFAETLLRTLGRRGPILVYNKSFEASRVKDLAAMFPDIANGLLALVTRMIDLLPITRDHYYHPAMMGSWSIKAVLPTIAPELNYENLEDVADGGQAQIAYLEATHPGTSTPRRAALDKALRRYCARDTLAMVRLMQALARQ